MTDLVPSRLPSLTSISDLSNTTYGKDYDTAEDIFNIGRLYATAIDNSNVEHAARAGVYHPSSVDYCMRANYYQALRVEPTDCRSKEFIEIVAQGHAIHDIVQSRLEHLMGVVHAGPLRLFKGAKVTFHREVKYDPETDPLFLDMNIGGTCDGILEVEASNWTQRGIIEIKSQNDEWFTRVRAQTTALPSHLKQSHLYAFRFNCPIIWVWYYNKNNGKRELKPHLFSQTVFEEAIAYFEKLDQHVRTQEPPEREETWFECKECVYRSACKPTVLRSKKSLPVVRGKAFQRR